MKKYFAVLFLVLFSITTMSIAQTTLLHSFSGGSDDGGLPWDSVIIDESTLYGMTSEGGTNGIGTIFKIDTDGSGFELLHSFSGIPTDGLLPTGGLIQDGSTLYGMTSEGGTNTAGTIFKIGTDGSSYQILHSFDYFDPSNGAQPYGALLQNGTTLYGMTFLGGYYELGTIFKIQTDGNGFELLHSMNYLDISNGGEPPGSLIQNGSTLYGMTYWGGDYDCGTVFKINADGSSFELLHIFECGNPTNGSFPFSSLIQIGSALYGMTEIGGLYDAGTIFRIGTDSNGFEILHSFADNVTDGGYPGGTLIRIGSRLLGMTWVGGMYDLGTIFEIYSDGSNYQVLHSFAGAGAVGKLSASMDNQSAILTKIVRDHQIHDKDPLAGIVNNDLGYSLSKPSVGEDGALPWWGSLAYGGGKMYGMTGAGGSSNLGTIFSFQYPPLVIISGDVRDSANNGIGGVSVAFSNSGLTATTDATGYYEQFITKGWSGTSTPSKTGFYFSPDSYTYSSIQSNAPNQDFVGTKDAVPISGDVRDSANNGIGGVSVAFSNGGATVITNATGHYSTSVSSGWNGTSTATKDNWTFTPVSYTYPAVTTELTDQDYVGTDLTLGVNGMFSSIPTDFIVLPAYPNPFNPSTTIRYGLDTESLVTVEIYDIAGKLISTLQNENQTQGWYSVIWNGTKQNNEQVPAGLYLSKITSGNEVRTTKLMLLK